MPPTNADGGQLTIFITLYAITEDTPTYFNRKIDTRQVAVPFVSQMLYDAHQGNQLSLCNNM
jgi:hypothetical protein